MTDLQVQMCALQHAIYTTDYYISLYHAALGNRGMSSEGIERAAYPDAELSLMCHNFWMLLPDSAVIRREPFFALCDIAEHVLDDPE